MLRKLTLTLLCVLILLQCTLSKSVTSNNDSEEESAIEHESGPHIQLLTEVLVRFADISEIMLKTGKKLLQDVVADLSKTSDKSREYRAKLTRIEEFVSKLDRVDLTEQTAKFEAVAELSDLLEHYNGTTPSASATAPTRQWTSVDATFKASLEENGLEHAAQEFVQNFVEFIKWFNPAAETYWLGLSPKEKAEHVKFDVWFQDFKREKDPEEQIRKFEEFFTSFE